MVEEGKENVSGQSDPTAGTSAELAEALEAVKSAAPQLAEAIAAAGIQPDELAQAHERATFSQPSQPEEGQS